MMEQLLDLDANISLPLAAMALIGLLFISLAISRLKQHKIFSATAHGLGGILILVSGILLLAIAFNIHTYQRLTYEQEVAVLTFKQSAPQQFRVIIEHTDNGLTENYLLSGDEWQLDARILRWSPAAQLLGLNALYRFERLSGRYQDLEQERTSPRTAYKLSDSAGLDIWTLTKRYSIWLPWIDAYYGNATYLPMIDNGRYSVSINQYGLLARPVNIPTKKIIQNWK